jgi:hypothetical protein
MDLATLLEEKRENILAAWFDRIIGTYPSHTSEFLAKQKDRFRNPVGHAINEGIGPIYDEIVSKMDREVLLGALDGIIRIRSVQDFTPGEAVAFVFQLKDVIRGALYGEIGQSETLAQLAGIESRIDEVALMAFEKYAECRETLHEVRNNEIKSRSIRLLDRLNMKAADSQGGGKGHRDDA